jgi:hypothetical protein
MKTEPQTERTEIVADLPGIDRVAVPREWQFSLRSLLLATTVASICLAIGTYFVGVVFAGLALVLLQVVILFSVDWLIRPANRRLLAFAAACCWIILGSGLLMISFTLAYDRISTGDRTVYWSDTVFISLAAPLCYFVAWRRWKRSSAQRRGNL